MNDILSMDLLLSFLTHLGVGFLLILIGIVAFAFTTKFSERDLINQGNLAVALKLWGKVLGLAIVIYTVWSGSTNLVDAFVWGLIGILSQVIAYLVIEFILTPNTNLAKKVEEGNLAIGFSLFAAGITVGIVVAASLTY